MFCDEKETVDHCTVARKNWSYVALFSGIRIDNYENMASKWLGGKKTWNA